MKNQKNVGIQILRIFACLMVFMVHFGQRTQLETLIPALDFGRYGVELFFIISGFLMCKSFKKLNAGG